jgi:hypothetical protein
LLEQDFAPLVLATLHPSAILRAPEDERDEGFATLKPDLAVLASGINGLPLTGSSLWRRVNGEVRPEPEEVDECRHVA